MQTGHRLIVEIHETIRHNTEVLNLNFTLQNQSTLKVGSGELPCKEKQIDPKAWVV